jgi:hypothetical protein
LDFFDARLLILAPPLFFPGPCIDTFDFVARDLCLRFFALDQPSPYLPVEGGSSGFPREQSPDSLVGDEWGSVSVGGELVDVFDADSLFASRYHF